MLILDGATHEAKGRIGGLPAAHGLAITPDGWRLIVGSFDERSPGEAMPKNPEAVSQADHATHHAPSEAGRAGPAVSTLLIVDLESRSVERRTETFPAPCTTWRSAPMGVGPR